jgi:3',5'-cyclic-AMP phosphodiesterase
VIESQQIPACASTATRPCHDAGVLVQLSDPHIGADWAGGDPLAGLAAAVEAVRAMRPRPDAVLVSGDLADHGSDAEYAQVRELLARIDAPAYALPGNHDDRAALERAFGVRAPYAVDVGPLRLVALDTTIPGQDPGVLDAQQLAWLDAELAGAPEAPTLLAMHHPPLVTGAPAWDDICLPAADRRALAAVLERHRQVRRVLAAHLHCTITGEIAGRPIVVAPSTYVQARLKLDTQEVELTSDPPGFAVHALIGGELVSRSQSAA